MLLHVDVNQHDTDNWTTNCLTYPVLSYPPDDLTPANLKIASEKYGSDDTVAKWTLKSDLREVKTTITLTLE
jgi:hypothetical protein